jgi:hypothetical protein
MVDEMVGVLAALGSVLFFGSYGNSMLCKLVYVFWGNSVGFAFGCYVADQRDVLFGEWVKVLAMLLRACPTFSVKERIIGILSVIGF